MHSRANNVAFDRRWRYLRDSTRGTAYPQVMRTNTILALGLLLLAIMISGALGVMRYWNF